MALLLAAGATLPVHAQEPPACDPSAGLVSDCQLDPWPDDQQVSAPSPFGAIAGTVWLEDPAGDAPPAGLDIQAVGIGSVDIADAAAVRDMEGLLKAGKVKQAVRPGRNVVVRVVLDRPLSEVDRRARRRPRGHGHRPLAQQQRSRRCRRGRAALRRQRGRLLA